MPERRQTICRKGALAEGGCSLLAALLLWALLLPAIGCSGIGPPVPEGPEGHAGPEQAEEAPLLLEGELIDEGIECPAFRADDGTLYTLVGDLEGFRPGDRVSILARPVEISTCMQGRTVQVLSIEEMRERGMPEEEAPPPPPPPPPLSTPPEEPQLELPVRDAVPEPAPVPREAEEPAGPTPEEIQAQIDSMFNERVKAMETTFNERIANLQRQLEQAEDAAPLVDRNLRYATVFYGTNRGRGAPCRGIKAASTSTASGCLPGYFYGGESEGLEVGTLRVTFPPDHERGAVERPFQAFGIRLRRENPERDVVLAEVRSYGDDLDAWAADLRSTGSNRAFLYVHGFATTFEQAAWRAAQIAYDIDFGGLPMLYSWPSKGGTLDYFRDYDVVRLAVDPFQRFLRLVAEIGDLEELHVVAHSMGNQLVATAVREMARDDDVPHLAELVLAAPDIDADEFRSRFADQLPKLFRRVTVYVSDQDRALRESRRLRDRPRAGEVAGGLLDARLAGIEVIDASDLEAGFLSHSYYAENDSVRSDLFCLISAGVGAAGRPLLEFADPSWRFKPAELRRSLDASACASAEVATSLSAALDGPGVREDVTSPGAGDSISPVTLGLLVALVLALALAALAVWIVRRHR